MTYILFGSLLGFISWGNDISLTLLSVLLFFAYLRINKRLYLFLFVLGYYLAGSKGLLFGTIEYYGETWIGLFNWLSAASLSAIGWIIVWSANKKKRYLLFPFALSLQILPPLGLISWINPLPTAGLIFPKFGFLGMILLILLVYMASILIDKSKEDLQKLKLVGSFTFLFIFGFGVSRIMDPTGESIETVKTAFHYDPDKSDRLQDFIRITKYLGKVSTSNKREILLPENALGYYFDSQSVAWRDLNRSKSIYAGAYLPIPGTKHYDNVLMRIDSNSSKVLYHQRVPVPVSMWRPFSNTGARATLFKDPVIDLDQERVGVFICYEQLLTYLYLQTMYYHPKKLFGISNLYWAKGTNIERIQSQTLELYGLLFGVEVYYSVNE
jgi:hypothetical protein